MLRFLQLEFLFSPPEAVLPPAAPAALVAQSIQLNNQHVDYMVRRSSRRRTLGLMIDTRGLRVAAPLKASQKEIENLLHSNARWIITKLKEWQRPAHVARGWSPGDALPLFGEVKPLKLAPGRAGLARFDDALVLTVARPDDAALVKRTLRDALKEVARATFADRLAHYCQLYKVDQPSLRLSQAATRWGSCARDREGAHRITLNWRMVHFEPGLIDYVIAHEVAHIKHMHHGPRFWAAVGKLYPDYEVARAALKARALSLPEI